MTPNPLDPTADEDQQCKGEQQQVDTRLIEQTIDILNQFALERIDSSQLTPEQLEQLQRACARISKSARKNRRRENGQARKAADRDAVRETSQVQSRLDQSMSRNEEPNSPTAPVGRNLKHKSRHCYICRADYRILDKHYHWLCPDCAGFNRSKRNQTRSLAGQTALVTGGRIKIGFQTAVKLLRAGAKVIVTSRFPADALIRFSSLDDFDLWKDRLSFFGLDFRVVQHVLQFVEIIRQKFGRLEILINNAAQSVKRPRDYYREIQERESRFQHLLATHTRLIGWQALTLHHRFESDQVSTSNPPVSLSEVTKQLNLPSDSFAQDFRQENSWTQKLEEIDPVESVETFLVNSHAPFLLTAGLKPILENSAEEKKYVINVTGADGVFERGKSTRHAHVNMSKAALNMMTRTSAPEYCQSGIYMNSVDTGWITLEGSAEYRERKARQNQLPPLDEIDGAARILDSVFTESTQFGQIFRNYESSSW